MAYINGVQIDSDIYLIEPTLYIAPSKNGAAYTAALDNFSLVTGATVQAKFAATNDGNATLNVNSTGAIEIHYNGDKITANQFKVDHVYTLVYDGAQWQVVGDINTNTQHGIQDNLTSDSTTDSLSAKQGKVLKGLIDAMDASTPAASGDATAFIDSITQTDGKITSITKKNIPTASTSTAGIVKIGTTANDAAAGNHNHDSTYSYTHLTDYDFTDTQPLSKYVTFDKSKPVGAPKEEWYNGFISSHSNSNASYIINGHTNQNEWYVGHGIWREDNTPHATAPTWYLLAHSGNVDTGENNGQVKIAGQNINVKGLKALAYKDSLDATTDIPDLSWNKITSDKPTTLSGYGITDAKIDSGVITLSSNTITPVISVNGHTGNSVSVTAADLGLSNALHFIGITSTALANGSTTTTLTPKSTNSLSKTTGFVDGDVVIDDDQLREYVFTNNVWILLGFTASSIYDSNSINASIVNEPTWISRITQATDGTISVERATLGILPITKGGTGVDSFTPNQVILSDNTNGTTGLVSRAYIDNSTATALTTTSNFVTEKTIYYGLPTINNAHNYTSDTTIYAPTTSGTSGQILISSGASPVWTQAAILNSTVSEVADEDAYTILTLGNSGNKNSTNSHSEGKIVLYSAAANSHTIIGNSASNNYTHTLPNSDGTLVQVDSTTGFGKNTQPIYISNSGIVTPLTYTANRLYYSASETSFAATGHYASETKIGINTTDWPKNNGVPIAANFYVYGGTSMAGTLEVTGTSTLFSNVYIGCTPPNNNAIDPYILRIEGNSFIKGNLIPGQDNIYDLGLQDTNNPLRWQNLYLSNSINIFNGTSASVLAGDGTLTLTAGTPQILLETTSSSSSAEDWYIKNTAGTITIENESGQIIKGTAYGFKINDAFYINQEVPTSNAYSLYVNGDTQFIGDINQTGDVTQIGTYYFAIVNANSTKSVASISAAQNALHLAAENISPSGTIPYLDFNGHIYPTSNEEYNLGASNKRWAKLYIGTAVGYGDAYTPVYWNNGVPAAVTPIQYCDFTIGNGKKGVKLTHAAFTAASYVIQIVIISGESNLNSIIEWKSAAGYINLTCSETSGAVIGYILVSRGDDADNVIPTDISNT